MATLWARFKQGGRPSPLDTLALSFQFDVTHRQINRWFCTQRKKYKKEMAREKHRKSKKHSKRHKKHGKWPL